MKKIVVILLTVMCFSAFGQSKSVNEFRKGQEPDRVFMVYKSTMRMFAGMAESMVKQPGSEVELPDMQKFVDDMNEIKFFAYSSSGTMKTKLYELKKDVIAEGYEVILSSNLNGNLSFIMEKNENGEATDFVVILSNEQGAQVVDVDGAPDFNSMQQLVNYLSGLEDPAALLDLFRR